MNLRSAQKHHDFFGFGSDPRSDAKRFPEAWESSPSPPGWFSSEKIFSVSKCFSERRDHLITISDSLFLPSVSNPIRANEATQAFQSFEMDRLTLNLSQWSHNSAVSVSRGFRSIRRLIHDKILPQWNPNFFDHCLRDPRREQWSGTFDSIV